MCILEIERTLNNVVACLALPGSLPIFFIVHGGFPHSATV
jgi:hypothetical protein